MSRTVLMVTPYLPFAGVSGGRARTIGLLEALRPQAVCTLVCLARPAERAADTAGLRALCDLVVIPRAESPSAIAAARRSLTSPVPVTQQIYRSPAMRAALEDLLGRHRYDVVHVESFYMLQNVPSAAPPALLVEPAIEYTAWRRHARVARPLWQRPGFALEAVKLRVAEPRAWRAAGAVGVVSTVDARTVRRLAPDVRTVLTPNGVDTTAFAPPAGDRDPDAGLFVGDFKYFPNVDAVRWFVRDVLPRVREKRSAFVLRVVGKDPPVAVRRLAGRGVDVVGAVDDVRPYLAGCGVFVCPVRSGSGTRLKLLEALACACPVVTTSVGAEGLGLTRSREALQADEAAAFADAVADVLADADLAASLGRHGRVLVEREHAWGTIARRHLEAYDAVAQA